MLVREGVGDGLRLGHSVQDLLAHLVHCVLHTGALVLREELESDLTSSVPRVVELANCLLDGSQVLEGSPAPASVNIGGKDTVPGLCEGRVLVANESVEGGAGALEDGEACDRALNGEALAALERRLDVAGLIAVLDEAVRVRLAVHIHTLPAVGDHLNMRGIDVRVALDKVGGDGGGEELGRGDLMLLCEDVDCVLDGVCGDDDGVVCGGVRGLDGTLKEAADGHLGDSLDGGGRVAVDLVDADVVLAIAGG